MGKLPNIELLKEVCVLVAQPCPTLCDSTDCSSPGSSVHGILQARILEWVAISFSNQVGLLSNKTTQQKHEACPPKQ